MDEAHVKILQMLQDGIISAEEAERLLSALDGETDLGDGPETTAFTEKPLHDGVGSPRGGPPLWWHRVWVYVLAGGLLLATLAVVFTVPIAQGRRHPGWLACTVPLLIFGALVAGLTWWSRTARWLHVRVREEEQRINISLPLPLRPAAWALRLARPWVPQLKDTAVDELILSLAEADVEEEILIVEVDEGEGEQVEVSIG